jgi:hypothetical protein
MDFTFTNSSKNNDSKNNNILTNIVDFLNIVENKENTSTILKTTKVHLNDSSYTVIKYDKKSLTMDLIPSYGLFRSVIINSNNHVVCIAPPKSIPLNDFINKYESFTNDITQEEFIDGTMINVFWDKHWQISTRNTIGATSCFYKGGGGDKNTKTFKEMFEEAAKENNLNINLLEKECCYSFVLQHPDNRIVVPLAKPQLYLVGVCLITNQSSEVCVHFHNSQEFKIFFERVLKSTVKFPKVFTYNSYSELIDTFASNDTPYDVVGVVVHNKLTGERTKIRNPNYEQVRSLRGNQPKLQYQYLCLRKEGKVCDFLTYYPEMNKQFSIFREQLHLFTDTLFASYISCYIRKEKPLREFSEQYRTHMFHLHQMYMNELREKNQYITRSSVVHFVNNIHPALLMYCLNFEKRKEKNM